MVKYFEVSDSLKNDLKVKCAGNDSLFEEFVSFYNILSSNYEIPLPQTLILESNKFFDSITQPPHEKFVFSSENTSLITSALPPHSSSHITSNPQTNMSQPETALSRADKYFECFTFALKVSGWRGETLLDQIFKLVSDWEEKHPATTIHKGTLYYFWAVLYLKNKYHDGAMILMNKALKEDEKHNASATSNNPPNRFLSLSSEPDHFLKNEIDQILKYIKNRLNEYNSSYKPAPALSMSDLETRFLNPTDLKDIKLVFTVTMLKLLELVGFKSKHIDDNQMAPIALTGVISDLLLVMDALFKKAFDKAYSQKSKIYFPDHFDEVGKLCSPRWKPCYPRNKKFWKNTINNSMTNDFPQVIRNLLINSSADPADPTASIADKLEADFWVCYGLRNFSAHTIKSQEVLWVYFEKLIQSVFNVFFTAVKYLPKHSSS